jgi:hypothetical protein
MKVNIRPSAMNTVISVVIGRISSYGTMGIRIVIARILYLGMYLNCHCSLATKGNNKKPVAPWDKRAKDLTP